MRQIAEDNQLSKQSKHAKVLEEYLEMLSRKQEEVCFFFFFCRKTHTHTCLLILSFVFVI